MTERKKIAVVLMNLGGPTSPETIRPFLFNFFMDKNIIPFPTPLRFGFSQLLSRLRGRPHGKAGEAYGEMGGRSPLLENTVAQQNALHDVLKQQWPDVDVRTYTCMRYWHPMADSVVAQVQAFDPDQLYLVSLYPQMSSTTFWSSFTTWSQIAKAYGYTPKQQTVLCCYPTLPGFIEASLENLRTQYQACLDAIGKAPRILFSAHSIPTNLVKKGDPYAAQCEATVKALVAGLNIPDLDYKVCYQSKVGPQSWLGPQTEDEIEHAGKEGTPIIIYPHAFVSEHVETIVELGIEYKEIADHLKMPYYGVVPTVGTHPKFIAGLAALIEKYKNREGMFSDAPDGGSICPPEAKWCCQRRCANAQQPQKCCGGCG